jgi:hypothetical protein
MDASIDLLSKLTIIIFFSLAMLGFEKFTFNKAREAKKKHRRKLYIVGYGVITFLAGFMVYTVAIEPNKNTFFTALDLLLIVLPLFFLIGYLFLKRQSKSPITAWLSDNNAILLIAISVLIFHPMLYAGKEKYLNGNSMAVTTVQLRDKQIDSLMYLGSTKREYFMYSKRESLSYIFRKDSVRSIKMTFPGNKKLIIR